VNTLILECLLTLVLRQVYSLTPNADWEAEAGEPTNPNLINPKRYQELVDSHVMFKVCSP